MSLSQFTIYQSSDASAPQINGSTGSLLTMLDAVLVNGYGTGGSAKPGAGWLKPFPNTSSVGCYQLPSGSCELCYHLMDNEPGTLSGSEARLTGWDGITSVTSGIVTGNNQWPTAAQLAIGLGAVVIRKSLNLVTRSWIAFADSRSCYGFIQSDAAGIYNGFIMGEFYSYKTSGPDNYRAMVIGRSTEASVTATVDNTDTFTQYGTAGLGHFISRNFSGYGGSMTMGKGGDYAKKGASTTTNAFLGVVPFPNPTDGAIYLARVPVHDPTSYYTRGVMRGFWHFCHPTASVTDTQQFSGSGNLAGRIFMTLRASGNGGIICMETSNTVETN
jgi:hypothetical protein